MSKVKGNSTRDKKLSDFPDVLEQLLTKITDPSEIPAGSNFEHEWKCGCKPGAKFLQTVDYMCRFFGTKQTVGCDGCRPERRVNSKEKKNKDKKIKSLDGEEWRDLDELGLSRYCVSSLGRVANKESKNVSVDLTPTDHGYIRKYFTQDNGEQKNIYAHVLVAKAFIPKNEDKTLTVDHKNRDKADNRKDNLRWATKTEQNLNQGKSKNVNTGSKIDQLTMDGKLIKTWNSITEAKNFMKSKNIKGADAINNVVNGKRDHACGFLWRYHVFEDLDTEIWKEHRDILISSHGRIRMGKHTTYGTLENNGYMKVKLNGEYTLVHRLVCEVFNEKDREEQDLVNHKDSDRSNNHKDNLEWCTNQENCIHKSNKTPLYNDFAINQYDKNNGNLIREYTSCKEACNDLKNCKDYVSNFNRGIKSYMERKRNNVTKDNLIKSYKWKFVDEAGALAAYLEMISKSSSKN
jgi:hypothetical protein